MSQLNQSPINLQPTIKSKKPLDLQLHWKLSQGEKSHGCHGLEINFPPSKDSYASLNGKHFLLRNMHFHHPAEHFLDGEQFDAEMHIVHQNLDDLSYLVLGVFLQVRSNGEDENVKMHNFMKKIHEGKSAGAVDLNDWMPAKTMEVIRYEGSLTTEPYTETVSWAVFANSKKISQALYEKIFGDSEAHARTLQPINRRYVVEYEWKA